jgi:hypothetical protein
MHKAKVEELIIIVDLPPRHGGMTSLRQQGPQA